ncbi:hypothetical protein TNCV_251981 [Trichonephila clavipes]|nr:hypothetical protein TNCV_251981 [Trichonephila clavipes]
MGWRIVGVLVNGTPVGKQEKGQFLIPVLLITGYQEREAVQDGPIESIHHAVRLTIAVVEGPRIMISSVELEPLQQLRPLSRKKDRLQAT